MENNYMIPANSKKSRLILGYFTMTDLILFLSGAGTTFLLLLIFNNTNLAGLILIMTPLLISGFLVLPIPTYHNVLQLITNILSFYLNRRQYFWKGWCVKDEFN